MADQSSASLFTYTWGFSRWVRKKQKLCSLTAWKSMRKYSTVTAQKPWIKRVTLPSHVGIVKMRKMLRQSRVKSGLRGLCVDKSRGRLKLEEVRVARWKIGVRVIALRDHRWSIQKAGRDSGHHDRAFLVRRRRGSFRRRLHRPVAVIVLDILVAGL